MHKYTETQEGIYFKSTKIKKYFNKLKKYQNSCEI